MMRFDLERTSPPFSGPRMPHSGLSPQPSSGLPSDGLSEPEGLSPDLWALGRELKTPNSQPRADIASGLIPALGLHTSGSRVQPKPLGSLRCLQPCNS
ncbi:hypothetical protein GUJ93_ZPchr0009g1395 [Zizania palustris]|uniref:Uncharacterized protein n=1 Tax=Zizania palustris TaxID=103762 RepID=A0A8J5RMD6_ZIZPA|nr:hypothetical protein GUJ93_ZPchr0009g1395 [Zizania palustris]